MVNKHTQPFSHSFLHQVDKGPTALLESLRYEVNIGDLFVLKKTCFSDGRWDFVPIIVEIKNKELKAFHKAPYLLQVWAPCGKGTPKMIYERPLQSLIKKWQMSQNYFIYKPEHEDDGEKGT